MCCDVHGNRMANRNAEIFSLESQLKNLRAELNESQRLLDKAKELYQELRKTSKKQQQQLKRAEDANNVNEVPKQPEPGISEVSKATAWRKRKRAEEKLEDAAELIAGEAKEELMMMFRKNLKEYLAEPSEETIASSQAVVAESMATSAPNGKTRTRLQSLVALRARLRFHISKDAYYALSALARDLPRYHLMQGEHKDLKKEVANKFGLEKTGAQLTKGKSGQSQEGLQMHLSQTVTHKKELTFFLKLTQIARASTRQT